MAVAGARLRLNRRLVLAAGGVAVLVAVFGGYWLRLFRLAAADELCSHLPLIPAICLYLGFIARARLPRAPGSSWGLAAVFGLLGVAALGAQGFGGVDPAGLSENDALFWPMVAWVFLVYAVIAACCGGRWMRVLWFELAFLVFVIPMPTVLVDAVAVALQYASADALDGMLRLTGQSFFRDGQDFHLPGLVLNVAYECSGIRSTVVLFITALLAGHLFLDRPWKKIVLVLATPLIGILRNAFRITLLGLLTVHVDERIIASPLHRQGGPLFFVVSLVVLFALLFALRAIGHKRPAPDAPPND